MASPFGENTSSILVHKLIGRLSDYQAPGLYTHTCVWDYYIDIHK